MSIWQLVVRNGTSSHEIPITIVQNDTESYQELLNGISRIILLTGTTKRSAEYHACGLGVKLLAKKGTNLKSGIISGDRSSKYNTPAYNMDNNLERMINLIETFNTRRSTRTRRRMQLMRDFIESYIESKETLGDNDTALFNVFNILDIGNDEVRHSSFLAWLLDAKASHYEGNLFFSAFLQSCKIDLPLDRLTRYVVRPEFTGVESIIDVLVYCKNEFIVFIENKIDSEEGVEQLAREFRDMRRLGSRLRIPHERQFAVFLTPDGREPVTGDPTCWQTLSYQQLGALFGQLVPQITSDKVRFTLEDWLVVISDFGRE